MPSIALTLKRLILCWEREDLSMKYHEHHNQNSIQLCAMVAGIVLRYNSTKCYVDANKIQQR